MSAISTNKVDTESIESPSTRAVALRDRLAWLREWEKAQWQEHLHRYAGPPENKNVQQATEPAPLYPAESARNQKLALPAPAKPMEAGPGIFFTGHTNYRFAPLNSRLVTEPPKLLADNFLGVPWSVSPPAYQAYAVPPNAEAVAPSVNWLNPGFTQWQPQFLHAMTSARGVSIWIRDFRIPANRGGEILTALRRQLASLSLELASLVINGDLVWDKAAQEEKQVITELEGRQLHINYIY